MRHVGRLGISTLFCWGKPTERDHLEKLDVDGRIIKTELKSMTWKGL